MNQDVYEYAGLTPKEGEVYEILLKLGESPVADILKETQDHPQLIYRALDGLVSRDLVFVTYRRHRKYVRAEDPRALLKGIQSKFETVKKAIPNLEAIQKDTIGVDVRVIKGKEGIRSARREAMETIPENDQFLIIGASGGSFYEIMKESWKEIERKRAKKNIVRRMVAYESQREGIAKNDPNAPLTERRFLPAAYPSPTSTTIYADTVAIYIFEPEPLVIIIKHPEIADSYRHYFESLWEIARP